MALTHTGFKESVWAFMQKDTDRVMGLLNLHMKPHYSSNSLDRFGIESKEMSMENVHTTADFKLKYLELLEDLKKRKEDQEVCVGPLLCIKIRAMSTYCPERRYRKTRIVAEFIRGDYDWDHILKV